MIALTLTAQVECQSPFVARLSSERSSDFNALFLLDEAPELATYVGAQGLVIIEGASSTELDGDVVLVNPASGMVERLIRRRSPHNTLLVTERCDQLCVMCSQPPKKTHHDRFALLEQACMLAEPDTVIGITGGEPLLYKQELFGMIERVLAARPLMSFHVLTNGQHFERDEAERLSHPVYRRVQWGIPLYAPHKHDHDLIVGKDGAFDRLQDSLATLACAGTSIELRTVVLTTNAYLLPELAQYITRRIPFIASWSLMQLENIGFARNRWASLRYDHAGSFTPIAEALDLAALRGINAQLFNFPRCTVPEPYRDHAVASISDWKQRFGTACASCREKPRCSGFFEWHPVDEIEAKVTAL